VSSGEEDEDPYQHGLQSSTVATAVHVEEDSFISGGTLSVCILGKEAWLRVRDALRNYARPLTPYFSCVGRDMTHRVSKSLGIRPEQRSRFAKGKLSLFLISLLVL